MAVERFPKGFVWGVATSAFQIEGAHDVDGRGRSIWDTFAARPGFIADGSNANVACDHYYRYREDVALMKYLGVGAYRFSIAWPRICPTGRGTANPDGLEFYDRLVDCLLEARIAPWVTLYHWDLPQLLEDEGGWTNRSTVDAFVDLADAVSERLGDRVQRWITHNEPWCASMLGYAQGAQAPGRKSWRDALTASHHLLLSHGRAVPVIRSNAPGSKVGLTLNASKVEPASPSEADRLSARQFDGELNRWFLDPIYLGRYPEDVIDYHRREGRLPEGMGFVEPGDLDEIQTPIDFLGVNYYSRAVVRSATIPEEENEPRTIPKPDPAELTDMGWEVHPEGLTDTLVRLNRDYDPGSLIITENGAAYGTGPGPDGSVQDTRRCAYLRRHLQACCAAIDEGVPLHGYFLWSLLDNFEWAFGFAKRFGIVWVDFETQERIIKASGHMYRRIIQQNSVSEDEAA
ncbi:MAG: beta-glucosidase [Deltaproteobacteria bacterium]|jgi:beta-glucosidase|nr:beta-glucosidase [Deltaproteobacteria bacterium]